MKIMFDACIILSITISVLVIIFNILNYINHKRRIRIIDAVSDYHSMLIMNNRYQTEKLDDFNKNYFFTLLVAWIHPKFIMKSESDWEKIKPFYYNRIK